MRALYGRRRDGGMRRRVKNASTEPGPGLARDAIVLAHEGPMARLTLQLLGGLSIRSGSGPGPSLGTKKAHALMAYLAVPVGRAHPRDKLASLLWGDTGDEQARQSLRQTLVPLRRTLPETQPPALALDRDTLALNPDAVEVDGSVFERLAAGTTGKALEQAAALYQGDLLEGVRVTEEQIGRASCR